jgi:methylated-DNA-[protein]-cysteine S-methyltransferase
MKTLAYGRMESPIGEIIIVVDGDTVCALEYADDKMRLDKLLQRHYGAFRLELAELAPLKDALSAYFEGNLASLDEIPVDPGGTTFQRKVWLALRNIPPGMTSSYGEFAAKLGHPKAARAVGLANSLNPIAIILPCHRVIGANGTLTGYAGGLDRKRWLLAHEGYGNKSQSQ